MKKKLSKRAISVICIATLVVVSLTVWTVWGNTALMVNKIGVQSDLIPQSFSDFKIAQVSDLHNAEFGKNNSKLIKMLSNSKPDIIAITGDFVDSRHTKTVVALNFAKNAVKIAPVYYVSGNHEARLSEYEKFKTALESVGVTVLDDKTVKLQRGEEEIALIGLSDPDFTVKNDMFGEVSAMTQSKLKSLTNDIDGYMILLSHRPELFSIYIDCGMNLVLSGHAHGGQFRLPFIGGVYAPDQGFFPKYDAGLYTKGNTNMIVSRGIGNSIIPIRFNNRPEIVVIELIAV